MLASLFGRKQRRASGHVNWNELWRRHDEISVRYFPKPFPKQLLLIKPRKDYRKYVGEQDLPALGGVRIVRIDAFPAGLMTPPFVDQVAKLVASSIDGGLRECEIEPTRIRGASDAARESDNVESIV
jgi:hypothetical protein